MEHQRQPPERPNYLQYVSDIGSRVLGLLTSHRALSPWEDPSWRPGSPPRGPWARRSKLADDATIEQLEQQYEDGPELSA